MKPLKILMVVSIAAFLSACAAGVNFVKVSEHQLIPGQTTKDQVIMSMGKPNGKGTTTFNGIELEVLNYAYARVGASSALPGVTPARSQGFLFQDGILGGKEYTGSFKEGSTYFDIENAKQIVKGQSKAEVISLMGEARGEYSYPIIDEKNGYALVYMFTQTKGFKSKYDILGVEFSSNDIVTNTKLSSAGQLYG
jgi:hypothetical protein